MSVKPHLQTTLSQRLVLTPQMRQRIELLAMTKLELTDMVTTELSANPILEEVMPGEGGDDQSPADDVASIDATTADYVPQDAASNEAAPPDATSQMSEAHTQESGLSEIHTHDTGPLDGSGPLDGEAEPDRE